MKEQAEAMLAYMAISSEDLREKMRSFDDNFFNSKVENNVIASFKAISHGVPAYKDFLAKNKINPEKINSLEDFKHVPITTKENYLSVYPIEKLAMGGDLGNSTGISVSSGSSGKPFYWPRVLTQDINIMQSLEAGFIENFEIDKKKTLNMTSLGLGIWTGGDLLSMTARAMAQKGYSMASLNSGLDLQTNIDLLRDLGDKFDQVMITAYPSFAKDLIDEGENQGLDWEKIKIKFFFGGEPFAEEWRDYVFKKIHGSCIYKDIFSCFGSSEGGIAGLESSLCIYTRQECKKSSELTKSLFGDSRIPSIVQYNPLGKFFESNSGELLLTSMGGVPLVKYNTRDAGNVFKHSEFLEMLKNNGKDPEKDLASVGCNIYWRLPFVYLFGRSDMTATIYGVNIYPENIRASLFEEKIRSFVSGKFFLKSSFDKQGTQQLSIICELAKDVVDSRENADIIKSTIIAYLKGNNSEYCKLLQSVGEKAEPCLSLQKFGSSDFVTNNKLRYVK